MLKQYIYDYLDTTHGRLDEGVARVYPLYFVLSPLVTLFDFLSL
jgi:hypothetical protein